MRLYKTLDNKIKRYKTQEPFGKNEYQIDIKTKNYEAVNEVEQTPVICNFFI